MSNFLAVDCSAGYLAAVAEKGGRTAVKYIENCAMQHSVVLSGAIDGVLTELGLAPSECDFFCAVTGPGSFTGIRIGISAIKGLALGAGKPAYGITAFELAAYNVNSENFIVAIDAARSHCYAQGFGAFAFPPSYVSAEELSALNAPVYGLGKLPLENYHILSAESCLLPAVKRAEMLGSLGKPEALYVRRSQAEEGRK